MFPPGRWHTVIPLLPPRADGPWSCAEGRVAPCGQDDPPPIFLGLCLPLQPRPTEVSAVPGLRPCCARSGHAHARACVLCVSSGRGTRPGAEALDEATASVMGMPGTSPQTPKVPVHPHRCRKSVLSPRRALAGAIAAVCPPVEPPGGTGAGETRFPAVSAWSWQGRG